MSMVFILQRLIFDPLPQERFSVIMEKLFDSLVQLRYEFPPGTKDSVADHQEKLLLVRPVLYSMRTMIALIRSIDAFA